MPTIFVEEWLSKSRLRTISDADLIIVLRDGTVAEQGSHEDLMKISEGVYRKLWEAQLSEGVKATDEVEEEGVVEPVQQVKVTRE